MSSSKAQGVKPTWAVLGGLKKPCKDESDGEAARDIKPAIPGLEKQGIDFVNIAPSGHSPHLDYRFDQIKIYLTGTKDGANYKASVLVVPDTTVQAVKELCRDLYGYEVAKMRLVYDGHVLSNTDTMETLQVEGGDNFDVYLEQLGG